jgi:DNA-binding MarR family transcriptional regulator
LLGASSKAFGFRSSLYHGAEILSGEKAIAEAYAHGYRLNEIASHLDVHYATVSRRLKRIEEAN